MTTSTTTHPTRVFPAAPPSRVLLACFGASWIALAIAETLLGNGLDALDDVLMIRANSGRIATAGLLHLVTAVLLGFGLVGLAPLVRGSVTARVGWVLSMIGVPCLGAFAMLHLLALEVAAPELAADAMNQYLVDRLGQAGGPWLVPILYAAFIGGIGFILLVVGLARLGLVSWVAVGVVAAGVVLHAFGGTEVTETVSHWMEAAGLVLAAFGVARSRAVSPER
jgi:hypothetical protein